MRCKEEFVRLYYILFLMDTRILVLAIHLLYPCFYLPLNFIFFILWKDNSNFEGEGCGICMDVVIDSGVLDCCQHWYVSTFSSIPFVTQVRASWLVVLINLSYQNIKMLHIIFLYLLLS